MCSWQRASRAGDEFVDWGGSLFEVGCLAGVDILEDAHFATIKESAMIIAHLAVHGVSLALTMLA